MNRVKTVAKILFYISGILAFGYFITALYALICLFTNTHISQFKGGTFLRIFYPFTEVPFMIIENNLPYIIFSFLLVLNLYGLFFWLAASVFRVFFQPKLFTQQNLLHLRRFYLLNLFAPGVATALASRFVPVEKEVWALVMIHFFLGIFTYFLAVIFSQGLHLQKEQDLFI
ncbi:MAG TPA: hypothetical protein VM802_18330 [Chitinophaga sp.]|uniref:hypothetical protein n=1 Tax=Chitinophaga sp. TaxID=1869181 RepID=UPI002BF36E19|nr:hypothetical protein [Chitinophaga sp.]HVI46843.1 hypothetical protein [Chitinophaga sp.]